MSLIRIATFSCLSLTLFVGCANDANHEPGPGTPPPAATNPTPGPKPTYTGPKVAAAWKGSELAVDCTVPTGGFQLKLIETKRDAQHTVVQLCLTAPREGAVVTQAIETKSVRVALPEEAGAVHVCVQRITDGAHYMVAPPFELACVVAHK
ncbi:MAG: hypothetical protein H6836_03135 [Planctomycetes bacterium]|nr:hypothetical protein [Planctomycetota bacterium]MCB9888546.1 hypothetical protein [Planctomycetota bacterium]